MCEHVCLIVKDYDINVFMYYKFIQRYDNAYRFLHYNVHQILFTWINVQDA